VAESVAGCWRMKSDLVSGFLSEVLVVVGAMVGARVQHEMGRVGNLVLRAFHEAGACDPPYARLKSPSATSRPRL
jgi:hypothetical protein